MANEQFRTGLISQITNGSQIVIGTASCDWSNNIAVPNTFKVDRDGESTYILGSVIGASRILLSSNYTGSTGSGLSYMVNRSFSSNRGYWRPLQGDFDFAEILSQDTIDKIDTDIQNLSASVNINASNAILHTSGLTNANASISRNTASITGHNTDFTDVRSSIGEIRALTNASIDALQLNVINVNASITNTNSSINEIRSLTNASIARNTASIVAHSANIVNANASITTLLGVSAIRVQTAKTTNYTLTATDLTGNRTYTNYGAVDEVRFTWATPLTSGHSARFIVIAASYLGVEVPACAVSDTRIRHLENVTATGGFIRTDIEGRIVEIEAIPDGLNVIDIEGPWLTDE